MWRATLLFLLVGSVARAGETPEELEALLRKRTQELLDAVALGDKAVWDRYLDPRSLYVTEANEVFTKEQLLAELAPLPKDLVGKITVESFRLVAHGDTAVATHEDDEELSYFGQKTGARYRTTQTWRKNPAGWQIIATQVLAIPADPPAREATASALEAFVGTYHLRSDVSTTVRRDGKRLFGKRTGRDEQEWLLEAGDVFFVKGQPRSRKIFLRDAKGKVTELVDRREGHDIRWTRGGR